MSRTLMSSWSAGSSCSQQLVSLAQHKDWIWRKKLHRLYPNGAVLTFVNAVNGSRLPPQLKIKVKLLQCASSCIIETKPKKHWLSLQIQLVIVITPGNWKRTEKVLKL